MIYKSKNCSKVTWPAQDKCSRELQILMYKVQDPSKSIGFKIIEKYKISFLTKDDILKCQRVQPQGT